MMTASTPAVATALPAAPTVSGEVRVRAIETPDDLDRFIAVPFHVHKGDPAWVPPLILERRQALDRQRNPFFRHAEVALWIVQRDGVDVGRISAQVDRRTPAGNGSFGMLCATEDPQVIAELVGVAEAWLRTRGVRRVVGPLNLSINQEAGLLVEGFDTAPMLLMGHDAPWLGPQLEALGYSKAKDLYAYLGDVNRIQPPGMNKLLLRGPSAGIVLRPLRRHAYREEVRRLAEIFNDAWGRNWGFVPFAPDEVEYMAHQMKPLVRERLVWFAEVEGEAVAFAVCLPNLNEAIRGLDGRLLPFGWAKLLWRLHVRGVRTARIPLLGLRQRYMNTALGSKLVFMMINAIREECVARGIAAVETSWILEDNRPVSRIIEALGGRRYKTYRLYERTL